MNDRQFLPLKGLCIAAFASLMLVEVSGRVNAQQTAPCRQLGKGNTVVIIEASNDERMQLVNQVVSQNKLQGQFCTSRRTGRVVWMSDQIGSVDNAVKMFDHFRAVGLVSPVNMNNSIQAPSNNPVSPYPALPNNSPNQNGTPSGGARI